MPKYTIVNSRTGKRRTIEIDEGVNVLAMLEDGEKLQMQMGDDGSWVDEFFSEKFGQVTDAQRQAVEDARNEMIAHVSNAWRTEATQPLAVRDSADGADATQTAYAAYVDRVTNAWRGA